MLERGMCGTYTSIDIQIELVWNYNLQLYFGAMVLWSPCFGALGAFAKVVVTELHACCSRAVFIGRGTVA
eukprot:1142912-Pelagomonas_calceolata.AAC.6